MSDQRAVLKAAEAIIAAVHRVPANADLKLAIGRCGRTREICYIGSWVESEGRYVAMIANMIDGKWTHMPFEVRVNGERLLVEWEPVERLTWTEVTA